MRLVVRSESGFLGWFGPIEEVGTLVLGGGVVVFDSFDRFPFLHELDEL